MFLATVLLTSTLFSTADAAESIDCHLIMPSVSVRLEEAEAVVNRQYSRSVLAQQLDHQLPGFKTQGLTSSKHSTSISTSAQFQPLPDGRLCMNILEANINVGYSERPTIYIASEIPIGSCRYSSVLKHEAQHVAYVEQTSANIALDIRARLPSALAGQFPRIVADQNEGRDLSMLIIQKLIKPNIDRNMALEREANDSIDTVESYRALSAQCPGEP